MRNNASEPLDWACAGRILPERNVNSYFIVIGAVFRKICRRCGSGERCRGTGGEHDHCLYIAAAVIMAVGSLYFAWRSTDFRKFLAGAFFVSSGVLFYFYLADVSVPLLGTSFVETPQISGGRSIVHFILFLLCFYFGFVRKARG